jgi:hypothetical protein
MPVNETCDDAAAVFVSTRVHAPVPALREAVCIDGGADGPLEVKHWPPSPAVAVTTLVPS